jgi:hypothetical protein
MSIDWNQFERPSGDFNRWKPETEGDSISGVVKAIRIATMPDGNRYPSLSVSKGGLDYDVLASQMQLLKLLAEKNQRSVTPSLSRTHVWRNLQQARQ